MEGKPRFGETITLDEPPPALGGATLVISDDGRTAIASDPDRDRIVIVDTSTRAVREVALTKGDEPGRLVEDDLGRVHVVLRRSGSIATIDLADGAVAARRFVCAAPRGIAHRAGSLYVACAGGELMTLGTETTTSATLVARLDRDLRDVVVTNEHIFVSTFRSAHVLILGLAGNVLQRQAPPSHDADAQRAARVPGVAWRMVKSGDVVRVVHQQARKDRIPTEQPGAYATTTNNCQALTVSATARIGTDVPELGPILADGVLPIDLAVSKDESRWAVIAAGNAHIPELPQIHVSRPTQGNCVLQPASEHVGKTDIRRMNSDPPGEHVAAAFLPDNRLVVFSREPAAIHVRFGDENDVKWSTIPVGGPSRRDTGHAILHSNSGGGIACASCHPEGGEDGLTWRLGDAFVRTQSLRDTLDGTGPYHWRGEIPDLETLAHSAFSGRMSGPRLAADQVGALNAWMLRIPRLPASVVDEAARARGQALFEGAGCASCHSGTRFTDNRSVDVGTGGNIQVPSLIGVALRAPFMHDGCAATLLSGFSEKCGGAKHATVAQLTDEERSDLERYLESL